MLQNCFPQSIRRSLDELPESLDETYEHILKEIGIANRNLSHRVFQCLTVAIRPLRVEELAEILAFDFDGTEGLTPKLNKDWRSEDRQRAVLSACSSLITLVDTGHSRVIQFSHFSVKEFLTSERIGAFKGRASQFRIMPEPAHTTLAQACLGTLLQLDGSLKSYEVIDSLPLAEYTSRNWVEHAQFGAVSSRIAHGLRCLFDSNKPHFAAWIQLRDIDARWPAFTGAKFGAHYLASPLYYASLFGFLDLAAHIIVDYPEQVNPRSRDIHAPLVAALYKKHFDVAELLCQHGAAVDVPGDDGQTPLLAAIEDKFIDIVQWLLDHGVRVDVTNSKGRTPLHITSSDGNTNVTRSLLDSGANINAQDKEGRTPLHLALFGGHTETTCLLLDRSANTNAAEYKKGSTPLHLTSSKGNIDITRLLLDSGANINAQDKEGRTPLHLA